MNEVVLNRVTADRVIYVIRATRKLSVDEMNDAIKYRCSKPDHIGARPGDTVVMPYSPRPGVTLQEVR
jgi:hypothetical protein